MMSLVYNISVQFGAPYAGISVTYLTGWRDVVDLSKRSIYFSYALSPKVIWVSFESFDFYEGRNRNRSTSSTPCWSLMSRASSP
jgi:penicillin V acylase-like amidase (Ntn superfamily)